MKHQLAKIRVSDTAMALREAEARLEKPLTADGPVYVQIRPDEIGECLELFQPRRPGWGTRKLETRHVNKLATRITRKGELDPVLVVKLGPVPASPPNAPQPSQWIVVDGHHRVAAYRKLKRKDPIRCEWFVGGVREDAVIKDIRFDVVERKSNGGVQKHDESYCDAHVPSPLQTSAAELRRAAAAS